VDVTDFLDLFIQNVDQITPGDANYADLRVERLIMLTEVADDFWHTHDWSWSLNTATCDIDGTTGAGPVPDDFHNFGTKGGVWRQSDGEPLEYKPPDFVRAIQVNPGAIESLPDVYSLWGIDDEGFEQIQTPLLSGTVTLQLLYKKILPDLDDDTNADNLDQIPVKYQRKVLIPGLRAAARFDIGDARYQQFQQDPVYMAAVQRAVRADLKGKEQTFQMPAFSGG
jgi:hypothetical protein